MGKATRWLKGLFGMRQKNEEREISCFSGERKNKKESSFSNVERNTNGLCHNPTTIPPNITPAEAAWLRSFYDEPENEKEHSKHAIAVAAATAAAADAAVAAAQAAVEVVRLTSQGRGVMYNIIGGREKWAAVMIQNVFRGYLARKALRALKGLVKLQAVVRGYLVRKQAYATLQSMEALIRAQVNVRAHKTRAQGRGLNPNDDENWPPQFRQRKSIEMHSRRLSANSFETSIIKDFDEIPKIVEVDTGRPKSRSSRRSSTLTNNDYSYSQTISSPLPCRISGNLQDSECGGFEGDECKISTANNTPRTPAKSVCGECYFRNNNYGDFFPSYMASTQSFKAKLRSQSAPKQRPEPISKRRLSLNDQMMESRNSVSGVRMQKSCSQAQQVINFKNAVMGNLARSSR